MVSYSDDSSFIEDEKEEEKSEEMNDNVIEVKEQIFDD